MNRTIGGRMNYAALAQQHRPTNADALAAEMRRLAATGLRPRDIASVLGVHPLIVVRVLAECEAQS